MPRAVLPLLVGLASFSGMAPVQAQTQPQAQAQAQAQQAQAGESTYVLMIGGISGEASYRERFESWAARFLDAADAAGIPQDHVIYLAERPESHPRARGRSRRENVQNAIAEIASKAQVGDRVLILLFGHGSYSEGEARFNLPGPDLTTTEWSLELERLAEQRVIFANTASASGPFVAALSAPGRTVVAATKTGLERNATIFGGHFVEAFSGDGADLDKNGRVSILEAFRYARLEVSRVYKQDGRLLTEHAILDDNGDGEGSDALTDEAPDGQIAGSLYLEAGAPSTAVVPETADPELRRLYEERAAIRLRVDELRSRKSELSADAYDRALEEILVELALKSREVRQREAGTA